MWTEEEPLVSLSVSPLCLLDGDVTNATSSTGNKVEPAPLAKYLSADRLLRPVRRFIFFPLNLGKCENNPPTPLPPMGSSLYEEEFSIVK